MGPCLPSTQAPPALALWPGGHVCPQPPRQAAARRCPRICPSGDQHPPPGHEEPLCELAASWAACGAYLPAALFRHWGRRREGPPGSPPARPGQHILPPSAKAPRYRSGRGGARGGPESPPSPCGDSGHTGEREEGRRWPRCLKARASWRRRLTVNPGGVGGSGKWTSPRGSGRGLRVGLAPPRPRPPSRLVSAPQPLAPL